jgi:hypothetical protein
MFDHLKFPDISDYKEYFTAPLYFQTIEGSSEQLCIGAIVLDGHDYHFIRFFKLETAALLYPNPQNWINVFDMALDFYRMDYSSIFVSGDEYPQPGNRISSSMLTKTYALDIQGAVKQVSMLFSSFHQFNFKP